jgi:peptidoglycan/xylan/chitin deacetylase (PgdA/CDA1 family)
LRETSHLEASLSLGLFVDKSSRWGLRETAAQVLSLSGGLRLLRRISMTRELHPRTVGTLPSLRRATHSKYVILCYHRVGTEGIPFYSTLPASQFEMQMRYLRKHYRVLPLSELIQEIQNPPQQPRQALAVTFDDGYSDLHRYALPILRKYGIPATVYLTVNCIETGEVAWYDRIFLIFQVAGKSIQLPLRGGMCFPLGSPRQRIEAAANIVGILRKTPVEERKKACDLLEKQVALPAGKLRGRMLSWQQIFDMKSAGICFGAHTLSHPALSQLSSAEIDRELAESKRILENRLGAPVLDFAFPFGKQADCGPFAYDAAARCGYRSAVTTVWGYNTSDASLHALRRIDLSEERTTAGFGFQLLKAFLRAGDSQALTAPAVASLIQGSSTPSSFLAQVK